MIGLSTVVPLFKTKSTPDCGWRFSKLIPAAFWVGGCVQFNQVTTAGSYASSSDKRVHFGLGRDKLVKEITLRWPSGTVQTLHNVKADQILKVTEGAS